MARARTRGRVPLGRRAEDPSGLAPLALLVLALALSMVPLALAPLPQPRHSDSERPGTKVGRCGGDVLVKYMYAPWLLTHARQFIPSRTG